MWIRTELYFFYWTVVLDKDSYSCDFFLTSKSSAKLAFCHQMTGHKDLCKCNDAKSEYVFPIWVLSRLFCMMQFAHKFCSLLEHFHLSCNHIMGLHSSLPKIDLYVSFLTFLVWLVYMQTERLGSTMGCYIHRNSHC